MWWTNQTSVPRQTRASTMAPVTATWGTNVPSSAVRTVRSTISA